MSSCQDTPGVIPYVDVQVDLSAKLAELATSRYEVSLEVLTIDDEGILAPLASTSLPSPRIVGRWFEDGASTLGQASPATAVTRGEVAALQTT